MDHQLYILVGEMQRIIQLIEKRLQKIEIDQEIILTNTLRTLKHTPEKLNQFEEDWLKHYEEEGENPPTLETQEQEELEQEEREEEKEFNNYHKQQEPEEKEWNQEPETPKKPRINIRKKE